MIRSKTVLSATRITENAADIEGMTVSEVAKKYDCVDGDEEVKLRQRIR